MLFRFSSVSTRLNTLFLLLAIFPLVVAVSIIYKQRVESIKEEAFQKLIAIRDLKVSQVNLWLAEKTGDIALLAEEPALRSLKKQLFQDNNTTQDTQKNNAVRENFKSRIKNYNDYEEIFLISAQTGKVIISSKESSEGLDYSQNAFFTAPLQSREFYIKDIHYSKTLNKPALTFSAPIFELEDNKNLIGVLVTRVLLNQSLYSILLERPGMGDTGETLIVNKDTIALNELRWYENAPLKLKINAFPAVQASQGKTGIVEI